MRKTYKRMLKVFTVSGALGILGGLLTPPRRQRQVHETPIDNQDDPELAAEVSLEEPLPADPPQKKTKPARKDAPKAKTAAATKPRPRATSRLPKPKGKEAGPIDQSGGSEK